MLGSCEAHVGEQEVLRVRGAPSATAGAAALAGEADQVTRLGVSGR